MSRKSPDFFGTSNLLVVILYIDFRDKPISEMNSTHRICPQTMFSGLPNVVGVGVDLIVEFPSKGEREEQKRAAVGRNDDYREANTKGRYQSCANNFGTPQT